MPTIVPLSTIDRVKRRSGIKGDAVDDLLTELLLEVSGDAMAYMGRHIVDESRTEVYRVRMHEHLVSLIGAPISSVTSVQYTNTRDFTGVSNLDVANYEVDDEMGTIYLRTQTPYSPGFMRVVYSGGMVVVGTDAASTAEAFLLEYPDVAGAVDAQIVELLRRKNIASGTVMFKGSMVQQVKDVGLLGEVRRRLDRWKRRRW